MKKMQEKKNDQQRKKQPSLAVELGLLLLKIGMILIIFLLLFTTVFGIFRFTGDSMRPAVKDGDLVIFYRLDKEYVASDVVILQQGGETQVRRVIAVEGDTVDINENGLMVNGAIQQETEIYGTTDRYAEGVAFPLTVGEGQVFLLGDGREHSTDSRIYGPVSIQDTLGKVLTLVRNRGI